MHVAHYANEKVRSAADSKAKLLGAVWAVLKNSKDISVPFDNLRAAHLTRTRVVSGEHSVPDAAKASASESVSSSSSSSESDVVTESISWFQLTRGAVRVQRPSAVLLTPLCRTEPFASQLCCRGASLGPSMNVCAKCIQAAPRALFRAIKASLRAQDTP